MPFQDHSTNTAEKFWNGDNTKPILESGKTDRYVTREAVSLVLDSTNPRCESVPLRVRRNVSFLVESERYSNNRDDVKCDMNGVYPYVLRIGVWTIETDKINGLRDVDVLCKKKANLEHPNQYHFHINSKKNASGLCRSIFYLTDSVNQIVNNVILLQYHHNLLGKGEVEFQVPSHGNRKNGSQPFYPSQKSTLNEMKKGLSSATPSTVYNRCISDNGGALKATNPGQLPRSRQQLYQMKYEKVRREDGEELLVYAKNKEKTIILEHHDMPEDLWVLGTKQMCKDMIRFCTSPVSSYPFSVDPTFNFGKYEVTPFTYRHLLLKSQRTGVPPVFLGPTALHHSKERTTYLKVVTAVAANCPNLANNARGYVTDGEEALYSALGEVMKSATALRCFNHFQQNCKAKLKKIGVTKPQEQSVFLKAVFGKKNEDKEEAGILDAEDAADLQARLLSSKDNLEREERRLLGKDASYQPLFWAYLKNNERMMRECMVADVRQKAGMPLDEDGMPMRSYTNQSECINNVLTKQKEAAMKNDKAKSNMSKLTFVRSVWEEVVRQQKEEVIMALCGLSSVYDLADMAQYLRVDPDIWFSWSEKERTEYLERFNQLTVEDVMAGKTIRVAITYEEEPREWRQFSLDIVTHLAQLPAVSAALASAISDEATKLLNMDEAISKRPTLHSNEPQKYLVAAKGYNKKGLYECVAHKDHVSCGCPSYKYSGVCKHSLCVAEKLNMLKGHLQYTAQKAGKGKATKSLLLEPAKEGAGKKGGKRRNNWRVSRQVESATCTSTDVDSPFTKIHHNNRPLVLCFLQDRPKAVDCKQCMFEFPRRPIIVPLDIVLEHEERWMYPDPQNKGKQLPSGKHTTKYYCVKRSCITKRFPYFNTTDFLTVSNDVRSRLKQSHWKVLEQELEFHE